MPDTWRCTAISWDNHHGDYWLGLTLEGGGGVSAAFGCAALYELMEHCRPAQVAKPEDMVGKLFELWWKRAGWGEGLGGDEIFAIRIHPSYRKSGDHRASEWLRAGVYVTEEPRGQEIRRWLVRTESMAECET